MNLNQIVFDPIISYHGEMILYLKMYPIFLKMMIHMCQIKTLLILNVSLIYRFTMIDEIRKTLNEEERIYHIWFSWERISYKSFALKDLESIEKSTMLHQKQRIVIIINPVENISCWATGPHSPWGSTWWRSSRWRRRCKALRSWSSSSRRKRSPAANRRHCRLPTRCSRQR